MGFEEKILDGEIPSGAELVSDRKGRRIIRRDDSFYKIVSGQSVYRLEDAYGDIVRNLRENASYIDIASPANDNIKGVIHYTGPE